MRQAIHKSTGMLLAIKIYEKYKLSDNNRKKSVAKEIAYLSKLHHTNLPTLHDVIDSPC